MNNSTRNELIITIIDLADKLGEVEPDLRYEEEDGLRLIVRILQNRLAKEQANDN